VNKEETCDYIVDSSPDSYYNKLRAKAEEFNKHFRVSCDRGKFIKNKTFSIWNKLRKDSMHNYDRLQVYRFQLYLPESIWEIDKNNVTTTRFK